MKMDGLEILYRSMKDLNLDIQRFPIKTGSASFECLFSLRSTPFTFSLTSRGTCPKFFIFEVKAGFILNPYFGEKYKDILEVLSSDQRSGSEFDPKQFFHEINKLIPKTAHRKNVPSTSEIIRLMPVFEHNDRPYFSNWRLNPKGEYVTPENLKKTLELLGKEAVAYSKKDNVSSVWVANDKAANWLEKKILN
ncbi:DUF6037 family protein [Thioclava kandeliae]|uniref:DUF6037 family protein n=1 Tax=Thioclava kandeliae TaxID=3070818 RepID=A0ABV1SM57_9RHOB